MGSKTDGPRIQYARIPLDTRTMARMSMNIKEMPESELDFRYILVCDCEFTNWMKAISLADQKAQTTGFPAGLKKKTHKKHPFLEKKHNFRKKSIFLQYYSP